MHVAALNKHRPGRRGHGALTGRRGIWRRRLGDGSAAGDVDRRLAAGTGAARRPRPDDACSRRSGRVPVSATTRVSTRDCITSRCHQRDREWDSLVRPLLDPNQFLTRVPNGDSD